MRDVALQLKNATEEQARGTGVIREAITRITEDSRQTTQAVQLQTRRRGPSRRHARGSARSAIWPADGAARIASDGRSTSPGDPVAPAASASEASDGQKIRNGSNCSSASASDRKSQSQSVPVRERSAMDEAV